MARFRHKLTPELQQQICAFLRAGAFPHIAAEAAGVPRRVLARWLRWGKQQRPKLRYRRFREAVQAALAQARLKAEIETLERKPLDWLKAGPGKDAPDDPGWSTRFRPGASTAGEPFDPLAHPEVREVFTALQVALAAFPDARAAAALVLPTLPSTTRHPRADAPPEGPCDNDVAAAPPAANEPSS